uniref:Uncharacterized protein n=1 Tax=Ciona savignyi TaxID=51511 RepID=H2Z7Y8_CIOSA
MAEKDEIPVCTLFQDGGDSTNMNDLFSKGNNASLDHEKKAKESSNLSQQQEPGVCNIFQTNSPEVDMFSSLAIVSENENLSHVDNVNYPNYLNQPNIENPNDVVPMFTEENLAATQTLILETNSEETTDRHIADTTMASILIDDSFENISNVSFDQPEDEPEPTTKSDSDTSIDKKQKTESSEIDDNLLSKEETVCSSTTEKLDVDNLETSPETFFLDGETSKAPPASGLFSNFQNTSPFDHIRKPSEDAFTSALTSSEADRRRDAWLPSESTSAVLSAVFTTQKRIKLEANHLTRPGLATSESLGDPIKSVLVRHGGTEAA